MIKYPRFEKPRVNPYSAGKSAMERQAVNIAMPSKLDAPARPVLCSDQTALRPSTGKLKITIKPADIRQ